MLPGDQPTTPAVQPNGSRPASPSGISQAPEAGDLKEILPQYEVLDFIGRGGMGAVYKARQVSLNRVVALKLLATHSAHEGGLDFAARFRVEAQAMARLSHPHIVAVHDFGEAGAGRFFFAMEFVEGEDLARRIEREGKLPPEEARRIAIEVCDALKCAHEQGVVHRDIKPSNILLGANGLVKVADFGLAKIDDPATATLTLSGTSMGSQGYAAPEVFAKASTADHRADIYSLGVLLYEMLTGEVPRGLFKMPSQKVPGVDERWDAIICKAMEEDREERFQSVAEMRAELERVAEPGHVAEAARLPTRTQESEGNDERVRRNAGAFRYGRVRAIAEAWRSSMEASQAIMRRVPWLVRAAAIGAMGLWIWLSHLHTPAASVLASPSADGWQDVLAQLDITTHRRAGRWKIINGQLENISDPLRAAVMELPVAPTGSFDLKVKLTRLPPGAGTVYFPFRFGEHAGVFSMSDYGAPRVGLEFFDGKSKSTNGIHAEHVAAYLPLGQAHEVQLLVRDEGIVVLLDEQEIYRWKGDWSRVSQQGSWVPESLAGRSICGIAAGSVSVRVQEIALREMAGDAGKTLPPEPPVSVPRTPPLPGPVVFPGNGHRYQYVPGQFTWLEAERNAKSMGGHLATLTSQGEHDFAWEQFSPWLPAQVGAWIRNRGWWIGGILSPDKQWQWITGEPFEFQRLDKDVPADARVPRLHQCDNEGGGALSSWRPMHYSLRFGYLVEWDAPVSEDAFVREVAALPATEQAARVAARLEQINKASVKFEPTIEDGKVVGLRLTQPTGKMPDISPVAALRDLTALTMYYLWPRDISCLAGLKLQRLEIHSGSFKDVSVVANMPLQTLVMRQVDAKDFSVLRGRQLVKLNLYLCGQVEDISWVQGMPLTSLNVAGTRVLDLSSIAALPLRELDCNPDLPLDPKLIRAVPTLDKINGKPVAEYLK